MKTYAVLDLTDKTFYVGSTKGGDRPFDHVTKKGHENWRLRKAKANKHDFFVFIGEDDGLGSIDRSEEQSYLDFYFGSQWCLNLSPNATGNPSAIVEYNEKVRRGDMPHSTKGTRYNSESTSRANLERIGAGTHNFLKENVDAEVEKRRIENVKSAITGEGNPMKRPEVAQKISDSLKGRRWWVNSAGQIRMSKENPGTEWQLGRKWRTD